MNYINLTNTDSRGVIINVDRIDCILSDSGRCKIYIGGSDNPIYIHDNLKNILDKINKKPDLTGIDEIDYLIDNGYIYNMTDPDNTNSNCLMVKLDDLKRFVIRKENKNDD